MDKQGALRIAKENYPEAVRETKRGFSLVGTRTRMNVALADSKSIMIRSHGKYLSYPYSRLDEEKTKGLVEQAMKEEL